MGKGKEPRHNVYAGFCRLPDHPAADMHGYVRAVVRARGATEAVKALVRAGFSPGWTRDGFTSGHVPALFFHTFSITRSEVERRASWGHSHEVLVCPVPLAYLKPEYYVQVRVRTRNEEPTVRPRTGKPRIREVFGWGVEDGLRIPTMEVLR